MAERQLCSTLADNPRQTTFDWQTAALRPQRTLNDPRDGYARVDSLGVQETEDQTPQNAYHVLLFSFPPQCPCFTGLHTALPTIQLLSFLGFHHRTDIPSFDRNKDKAVKDTHRKREKNKNGGGGGTLPFNTLFHTHLHVRFQNEK